MAVSLTLPQHTFAISIRIGVPRVRGPLAARLWFIPPELEVPVAGVPQLHQREKLRCFVRLTGLRRRLVSWA
jgi:hypothetical protein